MAVYNGEQYIEQAIGSALNQRYPNLELIVSDDGSTDSTPEILSRYKGDPKIKVVSAKHKGKVAAYNNAFRNSSEETAICFFAHDDVLLADSIEERAKTISEGSKVAYHNSYICDKNLKIQSIQYPKGKSLTWVRDFKKVCRGNPVSGGTIILSREIANKVFPIPEELSFEDWWVTFWSLFYAKKITFISQPLMYYRVHDFNDAGSSDAFGSYKDKETKRFKKFSLAYSKIIEKFEREIRESPVENGTVALEALTINYKTVNRSLEKKFTAPTLQTIKGLGIKKYIMSQLYPTPLANSVYYFCKKFYQKWGNMFKKTPKNYIE